MLSINDIIKGDDITEHYLQPKSGFKIYRYQWEIYAVRLSNENEAPDFVWMWSSHNSPIHKPSPTKSFTFIAGGTYGNVYEKTEDKVFKVLKGKGLSTETAQELNAKILTQKFILKDHNIDKYFVLGLWNTKNEKEIVFNMPMATGIPLRKGVGNFGEFIVALKMLNELGYAHPDLADIGKQGLQNLILTKKGEIKLIDLDNGLCSCRQLACGKDQWIWAYNYLTNPETHTQWTMELLKWRQNNKGCYLSDYPEALYALSKKSISLPKNIVNDLSTMVTGPNKGESSASSALNLRV